MIYRFTPGQTSLEAAVWFAGDRTIVYGLLPDDFDNVPVGPEPIVGRLQAHAHVKTRHLFRHQRNSRGPNTAPASVQSTIVPPYQSATKGSSITCSMVPIRRAVGAFGCS